MSQSDTTGDLRNQLFAPPVAIGGQTTHIRNKRKTDDDSQDDDDFRMFF